MWYGGIKWKMVEVSGQRLNRLESEATLLEPLELDTTLLPEEVVVADWPDQVVVYTYRTSGLDTLGYIISSVKLDVLYLTGVIVNGELRWSQIGDESEWRWMYTCWSELCWR